MHVPSSTFVGIHQEDLKASNNQQNTAASGGKHVIEKSNSVCAPRTEPDKKPHQMKTSIQQQQVNQIERYQKVPAGERSHQPELYIIDSNDNKIPLKRDSLPNENPAMHN